MQIKKTLLIALLLFHLVVSAQHVLKGRVVTAGNKKPVAGASVFFSNSSFGTVTNDQGEFVMDRIPAGKSNLIVAAIGYETFLQSIESTHSFPFLDIQLNVRANDLGEVTVGGYDRGGWEKWGSLFIENFIGNSALATHCTIKNPQVLKFHYSETKKELRAFSDEQLVVDNLSLGYTIYYKLEEFIYNFDDNTLTYTGYPLFEEMTTRRTGLAKLWKDNRAEVYRGSVMHFMRSLWADRLQEEGFEVNRGKIVTNTEKERIRAFYYSVKQKARTGNPKDALPKDSLIYYTTAMNNTPGWEVIFDSSLIRRSIVTSADTSGGYLTFCDNLAIRYKKKDEPSEYRKAMSVSLPLTGFQFSRLTLSNEAVKIYSNGSYQPPQNLYLSGFWAWWEKIATMLPFDYMPY